MPAWQSNTERQLSASPTTAVANWTTFPVQSWPSPQIAEVVQGRVPIFLDGGVRLGVHILEALALGASAVAIGRSTLYSLALDGWRGVCDMVEHLKQEFALAMKLSGAARVSDIHAGMLVLQMASIRPRQS